MIPAGCEPACPGCRYRGLSAAESGRLKQEWAERCLDGICQPDPIRIPGMRWAYRRKALLHAERRDSGWELGLLRRKGRDTELVPIPFCPLHAPELNQQLATLRALLPAELPLVFVQASGGFLTLVLKCQRLPRWESWAAALETGLRAAGVAGLFLNWNPSAGRRPISSRHQQQIFGPGFLEEDGIAYGALAFRQQIPELEAAAHAEAAQFLLGTEAPLVVDLYSGLGTTLALWRRRGLAAVGVELGGEACLLAERNAPGAELLRGRVGDRLPQIETCTAGRAFAVYTNPPRGGQGPEVVAWLLRSRPERIAYLSCNLRSLAAELRGLQEAYAVERVLPFDFFPQTDHVEALALLRLR